MPEYLHPGVYIEERPAPQTIEGVSTSTAGFVGVTEKGPSAGLPRLVTSFADFVRLYGGYLPEDPWGDRRFLPYAVEAFFNNGGKRAYIKRVVGAGAAAASLQLNDGFVTRLLEDTAAAPAGRTSARLASLRGIQVGSQLTFQESIGGAAQSQTQAVIAYNAATNTVTLDAPLTQRYTVGGCQVTVGGVPAPESGNASLTVSASSEGAWGRSLRISAGDAKGAVGLADASGIETTLRAASLAFGAGGGPAAGATNVALDNASSGAVQDNDIVEFENAEGARERRTVTRGAGTTIEWAGANNGALANDYSAAGSLARRITAIRSGAANPAVSVADTTGLQNGDLARLAQGPDTQTVRIGTVTPPDQVVLDTSTLAITRSWSAGDRLALATAGRATSPSLDMRSTSNFYPGAVIEIDDGSSKTYHTVAPPVGGGGATGGGGSGRSLVLTSNLGRDVASGTAVRIVEFNILAEDLIAGTSESFTNLSLDEDAANFVERVVNPRSQLIQVSAARSTRAAPFNLPRTATGGPALLSGGNDGAVPAADDFRGEDNGPGERTGIKALADIDAVSIIAAPGISDTSVQGELIVQCEQLKDRFAVLDPMQGSVLGSGSENDVVVQRSNHDTLYAALYYPWLRIRDPLYPDDLEGRLVPPSGHITGIYARVDNARGVHKAPANEEIRGILGLEYKLQDGEQDILNPHPTNINVIRDFRGNNRGIRVWGSRVITSNNAWKYIPVRRLFIFLEESMDEGLQFVVFEPNGEDLWARVRQTLNGFLRTIWLSGALAGATEEEAFFVRCDRTTMTEDDIANGRLIVIVGAAPLRPAEFVIIRIGQKTLEATT